MFLVINILKFVDLLLINKITKFLKSEKTLNYKNYNLKFNFGSIT